MSVFSSLQALGFDDSSLVTVPDTTAHRLTPGAIDAWQTLQREAEAAGYKPVIVSSYRGFDRQLAIWAGKACGRRPVLDDVDQCIDLAALDEFQQVEAIMRFSALPGASRHHWGTDFDVADLSAVPSDYQVQLTVSETDTVMAGFYDWLNGYLGNEECPFYRPYEHDRGGVSREPWHLSYKPDARVASAHVERDPLLAFYQGISANKNKRVAEVLSGLGLDHMPLIETVIQHFDAIYYRFIEQETP